MAGYIRPGPLAAALLIAVSLAGCGLPGGGSDPLVQRARQQAQQQLEAWAAAGEAAGGRAFVPVGELTGQVGTWEEAVGENNKPALYAGLLQAAVDLPGEPPGDGEVRWDDGTSRTVRTISAVQALEDLRIAATADCGDCRPVLVIGARLSETRVQTSRGPATAPAWEFALQGTAVLVTRIAVDPDDSVDVLPPQTDPEIARLGPWIESATGSVDGRQLTVQFVGAGGHATNPCGADYTAEAVESPTAVVVIVIEHRGTFPGFAGGCTLEGHQRMAIADLAGPLGDRAVLDVQQGLPIPVTLTP